MNRASLSVFKKDYSDICFLYYIITFETIFGLFNSMK